MTCFSFALQVKPEREREKGAVMTLLRSQETAVDRGRAGDRGESADPGRQCSEDPPDVEASIFFVFLF